MPLSADALLPPPKTKLDKQLTVKANESMLISKFFFLTMFVLVILFDVI